MEAKRKKFVCTVKEGDAVVFLDAIHFHVRSAVWSENTTYKKDEEDLRLLEWTSIKMDTLEQQKGIAKIDDALLL